MDGQRIEVADAASAAPGSLPMVTVVVPTRNRRRLLRATLAAILAQEGVDLDVVVVDEGSTDGTAEDLADHPDARLRVLRHETPAGVATARNRGAAIAHGAWIAFCDDDDLWAPAKLRRQVAVAEATGCGWAVSGVVWFQRPAAVTYVATPSRDEIAADLTTFNAVPGGCSNVVVRRDLLAAAGGFDTHLRVLADWDLWLRFLRCSPPAVVDETLVAYRLHIGNMSADPRGILKELRVVAAKSADLRTRAMDETRFHRWMGDAALRGGHRFGASAAFLRGARLSDPKSLLKPAAALVAPELAWRVAQLAKPARPAAMPPPAWLPPLWELEDAQSLTTAE